MLNRRVVSFVLALCLMLSLLPAVSSQAAGITQWNWNTPGDREGWTSNDQIDAWVVTDGRYTLHIPGKSDPYITSPMVSISASGYPVLKLTYFNNTGNTNAQLFWTTTSSGWSEANSCRFTTVSDGNFHTLEVDLSKNANWKGTIAQLRLDMTNGGTGDFGIDHLSFQQALSSGQTAPAPATPAIQTANVWDWNNAGDRDGWNSNDHIDAWIVADGNYTVHIPNKEDPNIMSPGVYIPAATYKVLRITYTNSTGNSNAQLFWTTTSSGWSEANSCKFTTIADSSTHTLEVDLSQNANWKGTVTQLRLDMTRGGSGNFSIDQLAIQNIMTPEEPKPTEPKPTEPKPTEPKPTEPVLDLNLTQTGKGRMPVRWLWANVGDTQGWSVNDNIDAYCVADGRLILHVPGKIDPFITRDGVNADASVFKYFEITYLNSTGNTNAKLYWTTPSSGWSEANSYEFQTVSDGKWHTLRVDLSDVGTWQGTITSLRFDISSGGNGNFELDALSLLDKPGRYTMANGYFCLSGTTGLIDMLRFDPTGAGNYSEDLISGYLFLSFDHNGASYSSTCQDAVWTVTGNKLEISNIVFADSGVTGQWTVELDGPSMINSFNLVSGNGKTLTNTCFVMDTLWENNGYSITSSNPGSLKVPFSKMVSSTGRYHSAYAFKRMPTSVDYEALGLRGNWIDWQGANGFNFNLRFTPDTKIVSPVCSLDNLRYHFCRTGAENLNLTAGEAFTRTMTITVSENRDITPENGAGFSSNNSTVAKALNDMYYEFSYARDAGIAGPDWWEWISLMRCWNDDYYRDVEMSLVTNYQQRADGYVHTWGNLEGWPFPTDKDSNHYITTSSNKINAVYNYFMYSGDEQFLKDNLESCRKAMNFLMTQYDPTCDLFVIKQSDHLGGVNSTGSNYWDITPYGYKSAYDNIYGFLALQRMSELEAMVGNTQRSRELAEYAAKLKIAYNHTFWNNNHYIQVIDSAGASHDYGCVYLNLEALNYGLPDDTQARQIMDYLSTATTASGKADVFSAFAFGPRVTVNNNPSKENGGWYVECYNSNGIYGTYQIQNGGTIFYTMYYELMSRIKTYGADNAYARLDQLVTRFNQEHMQGGNPLIDGNKNQHPTEGNVGVWGEFPESGLVPVAAVNGFMGISADSKGLHIAPQMPSTGMTSLTLDDVDFWNMHLRITTTNTSVRIQALANNSPYSDWRINGQPVSGLFDVTVDIAAGGTVTLARASHVVRLDGEPVPSEPAPTEPQREPVVLITGGKSTGYFTGYETVAEPNPDIAAPVMQGFTMDEYDFYSVEKNGNDTQAILIKTDRATGESVVLKDAATGSTYLNYLKHANGMCMRSYDGKANLFVATMSDDANALVRIRVDGDTFTKVGNFSVKLNGAAFPVSAVAILKETDTHLHLLFKKNNTFYRGTLPLDATSGIIELSRAFELNMSSVTVNGKTSDWTSMTHQAFGYHDGHVFVPIWNGSNTGCILAYNIRNAHGTITNDPSMSVVITSSEYAGLFEIEDCEIGNDGGLYFNTNRKVSGSDTLCCGIHYIPGYRFGRLPMVNVTSGDVAALKNLMFNASVYGKCNPGISADTAVLKNHYQSTGIKEGRFASPIFDARYYLSTYPDLANALGITNYQGAYDHFVNVGFWEGRQGSQYFCVEVYLAMNRDIGNAFGSTNYLSAAQHFVDCGVNEIHRVVSQEFSTQAYYDRYSDLRNAFGKNGINLITHYHCYGKNEGRNCRAA